MDKRSLPPGRRNVPVTVTHPLSYIERWDRLAADYRRRGLKQFASRSGAQRADAEAAKRLRHDMRGELTALNIIEHELRRGETSPLNAADAIARMVKRVLALVTEPPAPAAPTKEGSA